MSEATFIYADSIDNGTGNTSYYRVITPGKWLERNGHKIDLLQGGILLHKGGNRADMTDYSNISETVLLERVVYPERVEKLRLAGAKKIIVTFDDNYRLIPSGDSSDYWSEMHDKFLKALGMVDCVIVPSEKLALEYYKYCNKMKVVKNFLDPNMWFLRDKKPKNKLTIGWGGTSQHSITWSNNSFSVALKSIQSLYGDIVKFVTYGNAAIPYWKKVALDFEVRRFVSFDRWPDRCREFDIGIAPLYGRYDEFRSNLKVLEYCSSGIPFVATSSNPYKDCPTGRMVPKELGAQEWHDALANIIENYPANEDEVRSVGWAYSSEYMIDRNLHVYEEVLWDA